MDREGTEIQYKTGGPCHLAYLTLFLLFIFWVVLSPAFAEEEIRGHESGAEDGHAILRDKWGIEIVRLKITAAGHILDLRYRVLDPAKAFPVFDIKIKPVLIDELSGRDLSIYTAPRIGGMRQKARQPEAGRMYFILFGNPGGLVKEGGKVTLRIEDVKVEHIPVEINTEKVPREVSPPR
jgi:hypothetical protein